jgi:hypothetical protein
MDRNAFLDEDMNLPDYARENIRRIRLKQLIQLPCIFVRPVWRRGRLTLQSGHDDGQYAADDEKNSVS